MDKTKYDLPSPEISDSDNVWKRVDWLYRKIGKVAVPLPMPRAIMHEDAAEAWCHYLDVGVLFSDIRRIISDKDSRIRELEDAIRIFRSVK